MKRMALLLVFFWPALLVAAEPKFLFPLPDWPRRTDAENPIGARIDYGATAIVRPSRPRYADSSESAREHNTRALKAAIARLPDAGGVLEIERELFFNGPLENPRMVVFPQPDPRPKHFKVRGTSPRACLINCTPNVPAIRFVGGTSHQYPGNLGKLGIENLTVVSQGNGVELVNCGESLKLEELFAVDCRGDGIVFTNCYGFGFDRITARECRGFGVRMTASKLGRWNMIHARSNEAGMRIEGQGDIPSGHLAGGIDAEGNAGLGLELDLVRDSEFQLWLEANASERVQSRITNCYRNLRLWGEMADERGLDCDFDNISRSATTVNGVNQEAIRTPLTLSPAFSATSANCPIKPDYRCEGSRVDVTIQPGGYKALTDSGAITWADLGIPRRTFKPGEWFVAEFTCSLDAPAAEFFAGQPERMAGKLKLIDPNVPGGFDGNSTQQFYLRATAPRRFKILTRCLKECTPRLFFEPTRGTGPTVPHRVTVQAISCEIL